METRSPIELYMDAMRGEPMPPAEDGPTLTEYIEQLKAEALEELERTPLRFPLPLPPAPRRKKPRPDFHNLRLIWGGKIKSSGSPR